MIISDNAFAPFGHYSIKQFPFMAAAGPQMPLTESYVSIPPALVIRESDGTVWTLGFDQGAFWRTGEYEFDVVRCGPEPGAKPTPTGDHACRIEMRKGIVRIYGEAGWRTWSRRGRCFI